MKTANVQRKKNGLCISWQGDSLIIAKQKTAFCEQNNSWGIYTYNVYKSKKIDNYSIKFVRLFWYRLIVYKLFGYFAACQFFSLVNQVRLLFVCCIHTVDCYERSFGNFKPEIILRWFLTLYLYYFITSAL